MVFWGIKLKPKRPFFLDSDQYEGGKLRITNATPGKASDKGATIKCRVGDADGPGISICSFKPGAVKTTQLDLEFEEPVQFVLTGSAPVYLSGYFYDEEVHDHEDSEDGSEDADSDYEMADFINDDEDDLGFEEDDDDELDDEESDEERVSKRSSVKIVEIEEGQAKAQQTGLKLLEAPPTEAMKTGDQDGKQAAENEKSEDEDGLPVANKRKTTSTEEPSSKKSKTAAAASNDATTPESGKKKKKKKKDKKKQKAAAVAAAANGDADESPEGKAEQKTESAKKAGKKASATKKFPNGLEVEDLAMGKPDGKQAKAGKKVSISYTGKLKSSGKIFDSNIGQRPFQFRLGINEVIKGFDVGVTGMRIGDKRRVTIPPAMGYGSKSLPGIPPNSWLVFDIELVDVKG